MQVVSDRLDRPTVHVEAPPRAGLEEQLTDFPAWFESSRSHAQPAEYIKMPNRLLDGGERGFGNGISAAHYQAVAKVSKAIASRHLGDLLNKGAS
jgi:Fic family protein